jgi:hypothetical protein
MKQMDCAGNYKGSYYINCLKAELHHSTFDVDIQIDNNQGCSPQNKSVGLAWHAVSSRKK